MTAFKILYFVVTEDHFCKHFVFVTLLFFFKEGLKLQALQNLGPFLGTHSESALCTETVLNNFIQYLIHPHYKTMK